LATRPDEPEAGRVFVWAHTRWFERMESPTDNGAIEFSPIADSEDDLRERLRGEGVDMDELDDEFAGVVKDEFLNEVPLYPEAEEESLSDREP
jgi:hypothetical protein